MTHAVRVVIPIIAVVLVGAAAACRADEPKLDLRLRLEKGQTYALTVTVEQTIRQLVDTGEPPADEQEIAQKVVTGQAFHVEDVDADGAATLKVTFGPMVMSTDAMGVTIEYDSADPPDEVPHAARSLAAITGQSFTVTVKPDGAILRFDGIDAMLEAAGKALDLPDEKRKLLAEDLERQFGQTALKDMMAGNLDYIPDRPVAVGDTWTSTFTVESGFPAACTTTYKLLARKDGVATIEAKTKLTPNADAPPQKLAAASVRYKLEGTQEGSFTIDEATGWYVAGRLTQKLKGEMLVSGLANQAEGEELSIPTIIESTITIGTR